MTSRGTKYWNSGSIPLIAPDLLGDIISTASDIAVVVSDEGAVLSVLINPNHRTFGKLDHWEGQNIRDFLTSESVPKLDSKLTAFQDGTDNGRAVELNHSDNATWEFPIRYSFHRIGPDGALLMLGRDLRPIAEMQQQLVKAQLALERDYEQQRETDTRFRVLMEATRDAIVYVSEKAGRITDLNSQACALLGGTREELIGAAFAQEFDGRRRGEFIESLKGAAAAGSGTGADLVARRSRKRLSLKPSLFRAAGERYLMCRLETSEQGSDVSDELSLNLQDLYEHGIDAVVFTDTDGLIRGANESFLDLVDAAQPSVVTGRPLSEYLIRGGVDMKVLVENAVRTGQMRLYATKLTSEFGTEVSVEISASYLKDRPVPLVAFVIRDASRAEAARSASLTVSDGPGRSVMELVGSATLKDIVAETTDVVERMCIETAVDLTRNNRVAAAEMLGLSRQSLYVKLRKYGLLARDGDN
ncbi:MAG: transcriptional regulator PpsR [Pseudomonadota bacterium]